MKRLLQRSFLLLATILPAHAVGQMVDQSQTGINYGYWFERNVERWQEFQPTASSLTRVDLYIGKSGENPGSIIVKIGTPGGDAVALVSLPASSVPGSGWVRVDFFPTIPLTPGLKYRIYVSSDTPSPSPSLRYFWRGQWGSTYDRGVCSESYRYGDINYYDFAFMTYGERPLVSNPGFETGTDPWVFHTDGKGIFSHAPSGSGSPRSGRVAIEIPGSNVQLYQSDLMLESGIRYRLSFKAYSTTGHNMTVYIHKHDKPYTNYGLDRWNVDLGTSWKTFSREFTAQGFVGIVSDGRLRFWLAPYDAAGDVYFVDDVVLERIDGSEPPLIADQPENPGFEEGRDPWVFHTDAIGSFNTDVPGMESAHAAHIAIGSVGTNVQLYQKDLHLTAGTRYRLSFRAYSNTGRNMRLYIHKHEHPYTNYGLDFWCVDLGTSWAAYAKDFTAENFSGEVTDARLRFWLAPYAQGGDHYYIDDVSLAELPPDAAASLPKEGEGVEKEPMEYGLTQNYPNPFNPTTTIHYTLRQAGPVSLAVYNTLGEELAVLVGQEQPAGSYAVTWDASGLPSGVYFYRLTAGEYIQSRKMVLMR